MHTVLALLMDTVLGQRLVLMLLELQQINL